MNNQREVVYTYRNEAIDTEDPRKLIYEVIDEAVPAKVRELLGTAPSDEPNYSASAELGERHVPARPDDREARNSRPAASTRTRNS